MSHDGTPEYERMAALWEESIDDLADALSKLRSIYPDYMYLLPKTGYKSIKEAMDHAQSALASSHRAGRYVLGQEQYDSWLADLLAKSVEKANRRAR